MSDPFADRPFPRPVILAVGGLLVFALVAAGAARYTGEIAAIPTPGVTADSRLLHFVDRPDGSVAVSDARTGRSIAVLEPGTNGFVRGVMRGFARERRSKTIGPEAPVSLARSQEGWLTLTDPATGRSVALDAFGPTNVAAFRALLTMPAAIAAAPVDQPRFVPTISTPSEGSSP